MMYDVAIIGAGAGGVAAAKHAVRAKLKTLLISESDESFGGTCLNKGCIPTKYLLKHASAESNWHELRTQKDALVARIKAPLLTYLKNSGVDVRWGKARFCDEKTLMLNGEKVTAKNIIIATGSSPRKIIEYPPQILSEGLLDAQSLPQRILIVGAGYIGIEFACLLQALGKKISIVEKEARMFPFLDESFAQRFTSVLSRKGIIVSLGTDASKLALDEYELVVSCTGRYANSADLGLEAIGVMHQNGWIKSDEHLKTNIDGIYALGDVTGKMMLAYVAEYQAKVCIKNIAGSEEKEDCAAMAQCVFSIPQVAHVGLTESQAKTKNVPYTILKSNFLKFSSAYVYDDLEGFVQIIIGGDDRILGASIVSSHAAELISFFSMAIKLNLSVNDFRSLAFVHPTLSEIVPSLFS